MRIRTQERVSPAGRPATGNGRKAAPARATAIAAAAGRTDPGRVRRGNEDSFALQLETGVFIVCDGMGGAAAGETASRLATDAVAAVLARSEAGHASLREAVRQANVTVYQQSRQDRRLEGMGTTLVALMVDATRAWVAHVGDSRCYRWRGGLLERLTDDHSFVEEQVRSGRMTPEQARHSPMQNVITRAIGTREDVVPDVQELPLETGDLFLLASDGLTRELSDPAISAILSSAGDDLDAACDRLIAAANAAGGRDNITCILVRAAG